jgi:predicted alpha/beta superfamily hydrolase
MEQIKRFQVRGLPGWVNRVSFSGRIVDYWAPEGGSDHLLIAHDGQNIFDRRTATFIYTWKLAQNAIRVASEMGKKPPLVIGIFHSSTKENPNGRAKDLSPEDAFRDGMKPLAPPPITIDELHGNSYLQSIFEEIAPGIATLTKSSFEARTTAMIGSSMGGLATLYALARHSQKFHTALALSPHWVLAGDPLVDYLINRLPNRPEHRVWMSRGTKGLDASYLPYQNRADELMRDLGWGSRYRTKVYHRTTHNERSWASYVDEPIRFWLNT